MTKMKCLQKLDLSGNLIGMEACTILAKVINQKEILLSLDLSANKIGNAGAKEILNALQENETMKDINLGLNDLTEDIGDSLHL